MAKYSSAIIGHATLDTNTDHLGNTVKIVGGAVIYSSASAYALGHRVAAVTKIADNDMDRLEQFTIPKEDIYCLPSEHSTDMVNIYHTADKERRTCSCLSKGDPFCAEELPDLDASIYHLAGLVFGDFNGEMMRRLCCVTSTTMARCSSPTGRIKKNACPISTFSRPTPPRRR